MDYGPVQQIIQFVVNYSSAVTSEKMEDTTLLLMTLHNKNIQFAGTLMCETGTLNFYSYFQLHLILNSVVHLIFLNHQLKLEV